MERIRKNKVWYKIFTIFPEIIFVCNLVFAFVWGIVDASNGLLLGIESGFATWLVWQLIIDSGAIIEYCVTKMLISHYILRTEYLKLIAQKMGAYNEVEEINIKSNVSNEVNSENIISENIITENIITEKEEQQNPTLSEEEIEKMKMLCNEFESQWFSSK